MGRSVFLAWFAMASAASADVTVRFIEGAPKDRFVIETAGGVCAEGPVTVTIDMAGSAGGLIFDTTGAGAGVEVFQPFELTSGAGVVTGASRVTDGDRALTLQMDALVAGAEVAFTIDVDDTLGTRQITVSGAEIAGAVVRVEAGGDMRQAAFTDAASAVVDWPACLS